MTAAFLLEGEAVEALDTHLAELGWARLARCDDRVTLECADGAEHAAMILARAGTKATALAAAPSPPAGAFPAIVRHLAPFGCEGSLDVISVRAVEASEATTRLRGSSSWWPRRRTDRAKMRAILRSEDRLLAWRRVIWAPRSRLLSHALDGARPAVFDRRGIDVAPERFCLARSFELNRWLTA